MVWSEEIILHLRELWTQGHSTAEIGRRLGVSKNAIVGKAHRLDLEARPSPIRRDGPGRSADRPAAAPRAEGPTLPPLASTAMPPLPIARPARPPGSLPASPAPGPRAAMPDPTGAAGTMPSAGAAQTAAPPRVFAPPAPALRAVSSQPVVSRRSAPACCWPIGEPGTRSFRFCDAASIAGKPYCDEHARIAYVKIKDRKEDAA